MYIYILMYNVPGSSQFEPTIFGSDHLSDLGAHSQLHHLLEGLLHLERFIRSTTYPHPGHKNISYQGGKRGRESEQFFLHRAMLLRSGVVAVRHPGNPYFCCYYWRGALGRWQGTAAQIRAPARRAVS